MDLDAGDDHGHARWPSRVRAPRRDDRASGPADGAVLEGRGWSSTDPGMAHAASRRACRDPDWPTRDPYPAPGWRSGRPRLGAGRSAVSAPGLTEADVPHSQGRQHLLEHGALVGRAIAPGLVLQHRQEIDRKARLLKIDMRAAAHRIWGLAEVGHGVAVEHHEQRRQVCLRGPGSAGWG